MVDPAQDNPLVARPQVPQETQVFDTGDQANFAAQYQAAAQQAQVAEQPQQPAPPRESRPLTPPNPRYQEVPEEQAADLPTDPYLEDFLPIAPQQEEIIYEWQAPSRPFKQHSRQYFTTVGTIALLVVLILFFAGQHLPIAVVLAVSFLVYVMSSIPPQTITNQMTTFGIHLGDNLYYWEELGRFWFKTKHDDEVLYVEVGRFPDRLTMLVGNGEKDILRDILAIGLLEQEPPPTYYEKAAQWLQEKIPLDIE